ncbi:NIF family HAD-type phosphatase [Candidatus Parabeggiatoa sp. HSG14]|uniref:NIF family HAD-type phosphatase n=1 Tax=Candidatus Parabeggiatoa sp. HSG14 TaxID=3055593 RepID=UPI0025A75545|nr:NIF family HAD-type phosphatase [Thiotrichales bacterium HSG14]
MIKPRIAFDLDETLGVTITDSTSIIGFRLRDGCIELLEQLKLKYHLVLWTVASRSYLDKVLSFGLKDYFQETYSWSEIAGSWKDIRKIKVEFLIDDNEYYKEAAKKYGLESHYIIVPAYGCFEDNKEPLKWVQIVIPRLSSFYCDSEIQE